MAMDRSRRTGGYMPLRDAIDQLFEGSFIAPQNLAQGGFPQTDVYLTDDDVVVEAALPGADPNAIDVSVMGDSVTISGEIKHQHPNAKGQPYLEEIWRGKFQRSFAIPIEVDPGKAQASFDNGLLTLRLPKAESTRPRKIQVQRGSGTGS